MEKRVFRFFFLNAYLSCPLDLLQSQIPRFVVVIVLLVVCFFVFCFVWLFGVFFVFVYNFLKYLEHILKWPLVCRMIAIFWHFLPFILKSCEELNYSKCLSQILLEKVDLKLICYLTHYYCFSISININYPSVGIKCIKLDFKLSFISFFFFSAGS